MSDLSSTLVGLLILAAAALLFILGQTPDQRRVDHNDQRFWDQRQRIRHWISALLVAMGCCALGAGYVGHGRAWILFWSFAPLFLVAIYCIAVVDAMRTRKHFQQRLRRMQHEAKESLSRNVE